MDKTTAIHDGERIPTLVRQNQNQDELTPDTIVVCINRGRETFDVNNKRFRDATKFDGEDYEIKPGKFLAKYRQAKHFQRRLIVPGTRNIEEQSEMSFIGIIEIHATGRKIQTEDETRPFTTEELQKFGERSEALERSEGEVTLMSTKSAPSSSKIRSEGRRTDVAAFVGGQQVSSDEVMAPPEGGSVARQETAEALATGALEPQGGASQANVKGTGSQTLKDAKDKVNQTK